MPGICVPSTLPNTLENSGGPQNKINSCNVVLVCDQCVCFTDAHCEWVTANQYCGGQ